MLIVTEKSTKSIKPPQHFIINFIRILLKKTLSRLNNIIHSYGHVKKYLLFNFIDEKI